MTKRRWSATPTTNGLLKEAVRGGAVLLLGLALTVISPPPVRGAGVLAILGQRSQQEEQQRQQQEQQQREQQQREQQARQAHVVNSSGGATPSTTKELPTNPSRSAAASNERDSERAKIELRRRTCEKGPCKETPTATKPDVRQGVVQCQPHEIWNGAACVAASPAQCRAGEFWDGLCCVNTAQKCASFNARGATRQNEIRGIRTEMEQACRNNPPGQRCVELRQSYDGAIQRYRMLMNEAPVACQSLLLDPLAI